MNPGRGRLDAPQLHHLKAHEPLYLYGIQAIIFILNAHLYTKLYDF